jgi:hypothetical protein
MTEGQQTQWVDVPKRKDNDLDSIEVGSASKGGVLKIYFDSTNDNYDTMRGKVDIANAAILYARGRLSEGPRSEGT